MKLETLSSGHRGVEQTIPLHHGGDVGGLTMAKWHDCTLGDLLEVKQGFAFLGEYFGNSGTHVVLTPGNLLEDDDYRERSGKAKWHNGPIPDDYVLNKGDLIVAMTEQAEELLGSSAITAELALPPQPAFEPPTIPEKTRATA